ncbi:MAG: hypothetical protein ACOH18_04825 [Candidatus Saccharimonadaceae bacterium]
MNPEYPFQPQQQPVQPQQQPNQSYYVPGAAPQPLPQPGYTPIQPANLPPIKRKPSKLLLIFTIVFAILAVAGIGVAIWAYVNYMDQKNNVDSKVTVAVAEATKKQADKLAADFIQQEKEPNRSFVGPDDYGRLAFKYPKTWSLYVAKDASKGGDFEAYLNPGGVPAISVNQQYALHVTIKDDDYDKVVSSYTTLVKSGKLVSSSVSADGQNGTRLDGSFSTDINGYAVIFKIRDKTVIIRSDAQTFKADFDALIQTITFNK